MLSGETDVPLLFAWPTAGQRRSLVAGMEGFARNCARHGRKHPFLVALDCAFEALDAEIGGGITRIASDYAIPVSICDRDSRERFIHELGNEFDPELLGYALLSDEQMPGPGNNRNAVQLASAGCFVISTDDDILCAPGVLRSSGAQSSDFIFSNDPFPLEYFYYPDRATVLADISDTPIDVAAQHMSFLGRQTPNGKVFVTNPGNYGDSGFGRARIILSQKGSAREQTIKYGYTSVCLSREVIRIAGQNLVSSSMHLMGMQSGYDMRTPLPPYLPVGRNEDGLFAMLLRICCPASLTAYPTFGFLHDPAEARAFDHKSLTDFKPYLSELMMALSLACFPPAEETDSRVRMRTLGENYADVSSLTTGDFIQVLHDVWSQGARAYAESLEELLETYRLMPKAWASDVDEHLENIYTMLREPLYLLGDNGCGLSVEQVKAHVDRYGRLLSIWPDLLDASAHLNSEGKGIARSI